MVPAIFGLIGVVVGGVITGGVSFAFRRWDERREQTRVRRLLASELETAWMHLRLILKHGGGRLPEHLLTEQPASFLAVSEWNEHKSAFAGATVPDGEWRAVDRAYSNITAIRHRLFLGGDVGDEIVRELSDGVATALAALGKPIPAAELARMGY